MRIFATVAIMAWIVLGSLTAYGQEFLRGDVNIDGRVSALEDATVLLDWGFEGGTEPPCMDAADVNDNGVVGALSDAIRLLQWGFANGVAPPAPGTDECGEDSGTSEGCDTPPAECGTSEPDLEVDESIVLSIGSAVVDDAATESVLIYVSLDNGGAETVRGFQFGVCHDPDVVCVAAGGLARPDDVEGALFFAWEMTDGAWGVGCFLPTPGDGPHNHDGIPPGDAQDVAVVAYSVMGEGTTDLAFCDHPGAQAWPIRCLTSAGMALPAVDGGAIAVTAFDGSGDCTAVPPEDPPPPPPPPVDNPYDDVGDCIVNDGEGEYGFVVGDGSGMVGGEVTIPIQLSVDGSCLVGWSLGLCVDPDNLGYVEAEEGHDLELGQTYFFGALQSSTSPGDIAIGSVFLFSDIAFVDRDAPYEIVRVTYEIEQDFGTTTVAVCEPDVSPPVIPLVVQQDGEDGLPVDWDTGVISTNDGLVSVIPSRAFERGDVDANGEVAALSDAIYLLRYAFVEDTAPRCMDAADVDDNGQVSGLIDTMYLLRWGFSGGNEPPAPFGLCAVDASDDGVSCLEASAACTN